MSTTDKVQNAAEQAKGKVHEAAGKASGDRDQEMKGKAEQGKSDLKQAGEKVKDAAGKLKGDK